MTQAALITLPRRRRRPSQEHRAHVHSTPARGNMPMRIEISLVLGAYFSCLFGLTCNMWVCDLLLRTRVQSTELQGEGPSKLRNSATYRCQCHLR